MTTKRSATLKQFLLRVHPDHFRRQPRVHDENLRSMQFLNAFLDGGGGGVSARQVHFSLYTTATDSSDAPEVLPQLRRFALALGTDVETRMNAILRDCGVSVGDAPPPPKEPPQSLRDVRFSRSRQHDHRRPRERTRSREHNDDADFGASLHAMYESLRAQSRSRSTRAKKPILSMKDFLAFTQAEQTLAVQQQRFNAWRSIQSVKATLAREFAIGDVATSCGWAAVHLNATLMVLLKTLRKYVRAQSSSGGGNSVFTPSAFLRGVCIDVSSQPSGIDVNDEYRVHLNPTDVPLQWVEVLETIDDAMLEYMAAARASLATLESDATAALNGATIVRGHTCTALSYRGFLQAMAYGEQTRDPQTTGGSASLQETLTLVVEDNSHQWQILRNGDVQVPCDSSVDDVFCFAALNRERIREQRSKWREHQHELQMVATMCSHALGVKSITHADTIAVEDAVAACRALLSLAAEVRMGTVDAKKVPAELCGGKNCDLASFLRGQQLRINRLYGLDQDGCFTIPFDWYK